MFDDRAEQTGDSSARRLFTVAIAQSESERQAEEQYGHGRAEDGVASGPVAGGEIAGTEKIVDDAAGAGADGEKQGLIEKNRAVWLAAEDFRPVDFRAIDFRIHLLSCLWPFQPERNAKKNENHHGPGGHHPDMREFEIEQSDDAAGSEAGKEFVEVQALVVLRVLFVRFQL